MKKLIFLGGLLAAFVTLAGLGFVLAENTATVISHPVDEIYYITEPGNYIVEGEVGPIFVEASNVNLHLNKGIVYQVKAVSPVGLSIDEQTNVHISGPGRVLCDGEHATRGIDVYHGSNNHINGITLIDCAYWGILLQASNENMISGNVIIGSGHGILLDSSESNSVKGNTTTKCGMGISVQNSHHNDFKDNFAQDNNGWGIIVDTESGFVTNNRFIGNTALNNVRMDLKDTNGNCEANTWLGNTFNTANLDCIR